jgi:hypothetical protein
MSSDDHGNWDHLLWSIRSPREGPATPRAASEAAAPAAAAPAAPGAPPPSPWERRTTLGSPAPAAAPGALPWTADVRAREWSVGDVIAGRYQVHRVILSGMGVVYLCYDQEAREPVAIKTYRDTPRQAEPPGPPGPPGPPSPAGPMADESRLLAQLFEAEALVWVRLGHHPHIIQAKSVLRLAGKPYVFLEYVPGPAGSEASLRRLLRE